MCSSDISHFNDFCVLFRESELIQEQWIFSNKRCFFFDFCHFWICLSLTHIYQRTIFAQHEKWQEISIWFRLQKFKLFHFVCFHFPSSSFSIWNKWIKLRKTSGSALENPPKLPFGSIYFVVKWERHKVSNEIESKWMKTFYFWRYRVYLHFYLFSHTESFPAD